MSVVIALARSGGRRRLGALAGLATVLALGLGVAMASLEAARRTERAYPAYLRRAEVGEVVINPSLNTDRAEEIIASSPGVLGYASHGLLTATPDDGAPRTQSDVDSGATQVLVSDDGRYIDQDRPVVHEGRMVAKGAEAFVNTEMAETLGLEVGDTLPLAFWSNSYSLPGGSSPDEVINPYGRSTARVVGIGVFADEALVDGLYPRQRALVTDDVAARFDCSPPHPAVDDDRSIEQLAVSLLPTGCSTSYRYFSIRVEGGDAGVGRLIDVAAERFLAENERLPAALREDFIGFEAIPTVTADERDRVQRSLDPTVTALQLFGATAIVSTLVVVLLGVVRVTRRDGKDVSTWRDLGATSGLRMAAVALPITATAGVGLAGALLVGWLASGLGPVAGARTIEPAGRLGLSGDVVVIALGGAAAALIVGILGSARGSGRVRPLSTSRPPRRQPRSLSRSSTPARPLGVAAAVDGSGSKALLAAAVAAVGAVMATVVFSASLSGFVDRPGRFGWPYDVAATLNYGYGDGTDPAAIAATLDHPDVERWGLASISNVVTINGQTVPTVAGRPGFDAMALPVVEGALPVADDEIALGSRTADRLGLGVGDTAQVATPAGVKEVKVRGLVVLPPVGAFLSDRAALGTGALLSSSFLEAVLSEFEEDTGSTPGELADRIAGFVGIDLRAGVDPDEFLADIADELPGWNPIGGAPFVYPRPVRPAAVANVADMRAVPVALAAVLAVAMAVGLTVTIAVATRTRRRELAILRALGCLGHQLRTTVRWQALTVVGIGLAVGGPLGVAAGRSAYRAFAEDLGVRPEPLVPLAWLAAITVVTLGTGLVAAAGPGRRAARIPAAEALRQE